MENPQTMRTKPTRAPSENRPLYGPSPKRAISAARGSRSVVRVWTPRNTTIPIRSVTMIRSDQGAKRKQTLIRALAQTRDQRRPRLPQRREGMDAEKHDHSDQKRDHDPI